MERPAVMRMLRRRTVRRPEQGMTLVEVIVGVVILTMITGAASAALITGLKNSRPTTQRVRESNDAQVIAAFLIRDAQAAGGINPFTATTDPSLGVSTTDAAGCSTGDTLVMRFKWRDFTSSSAYHDHVATYYLNPLSHQLTRRTCVDGTNDSSTPLGGSISSVSGACVTNSVPSACGPALPDIVQLNVTEIKLDNEPAPYSYTLQANVRPESQIAPNGSTGSVVPVMALGGSVCTDGTAGVDVSDSATTVHIYGGVIVNATNGTGCPAFNYGAHPTYTSGVVDIVSGGSCPGCPFPTSSFNSPLGDPFASLAVPGSCPNPITGSNPGTTTVGGVVHYHPGTYPQVVNISNGTVVFDTGIYIFCLGVNISGGTVSSGAGGVLWYFANSGTLTTSGNTVLNLSPTTAGNYAGLLIWQDKLDTTSPMSLAGNGSLTFNGTIYAPTVEVQFRGTAVTSVLAVYAATVSFGGNHQIGVGVPPVPLAISGPSSLPNWTINKVYPNDSTTLITRTGGSGIDLWSAPGLPPGLTINASTGQISGTPTAAGTYNFTVTDTDSYGDVATKGYSITISGPPSINNVPLPNWTINRDYPGTAMTATGGTTPYAWSATGLPAGLTIAASTGVVSGTPSATGTSSVVVSLTDAAGATATRNYTITINPAPSITGPASLPTGTAGTAYPTRTMTGTGGTTPYTWTASGLPGGVSINASTGVISGTPSAAGTFNVTVTLTDVAGAAATQPYTVTINPAPGIATGSLPNGEINRPYNFTVTPTGGTPPYSWSATGLPNGITIDASTGVLSGTPTVAGTFPTAKITLVDSVGASSSKTYSFVIAAAPSITGPASLSNWTINRDYPGTQITATGGITPFTWSATNLPPGLSINASTGLVSGTPSATGTFPIVVTVSDAAGGTATKNYSITINDVPTIPTSSLPSGEQTVAYSAPVTVANGTPAYTWAASGLPTGLTINASTGMISGTPTVSGSYDVTITVTDVAGASASRILTINLVGAPSVSNPATLPTWTVNRPYPATTVSGSGGTAPYTWSATGLPAGLAIDPSTGTISGTPTATGTFSVTVKVTDSMGGVATKPYSLVVNAAPSITTSSLPSATVGGTYPSTTVSAGAGTPAYTWSATGLPPGISLDASTGVLSGTPTAAGTFSSVVITVTDAAGATGSRTLTITINTAPTITTASLPNGEANVPYNTAVTATSGTTPYTWSATGLPAGLSINAATGVISGTTTTAGSFTVNLTLTDASGVVATKSLTLVVNLHVNVNACNTKKGNSVNFTLTASGGTAPYTWSASGQPAWVSVSAGGVITGVVPDNTTVSFTVNVTGSLGNTGTATFTINVVGNPTAPVC